MTLPLPDIDTSDFESLLEQARLLIPRYNDTWTDFNVHDPGIMLIELAAWITDQQLYTAGFVSDEHLAAFAALFGVSANAARPARGLLWPDTNAIASNPTRGGSNLPAGSVVTTQQQPEVLFRTHRDCHLSAARPVSPIAVVTAIDASATGASITLVFDRPPGRRRWRGGNADHAGCRAGRLARPARQWCRRSPEHRLPAHGEFGGCDR